MNRFSFTPSLISDDLILSNIKLPPSHSSISLHPSSVAPMTDLKVHFLHSLPPPQLSS